MSNSTYQELVEKIKANKTNSEIIAERLDYLKSSEYQRTQVHGQSNNTLSFWQGFISPDVSIGIGAGLFGSYYMDIEDIYNELLEVIRGCATDGKPLTPRQVVDLVYDYFSYNEESPNEDMENYVNKRMENETWKKWYPDESKRRSKITEECRELLIVDSEDDSERTPLSKFKGTGSAMCTEYSVLTQNLFAFVGRDIHLLAGERNGNAHSYNIVWNSSKGGYLLYDVGMGEFCKLDNLANIEDLTQGRTLKVNGNEYTCVYRAIAPASISNEFEDSDGQNR